MLYGYILISCLVLLLLGYSIGRRIGIKEGSKKARSHAVIELKLDYYHHKKCPICANNRAPTEEEEKIDVPRQRNIT
ncbi:hypothetical protein [Clostridium formicaceticum]|uniref:Uncharacterized protein n=1 Tax=Clostridium formicaceticum TaxID=1497 RepID=A0AAC9RKF5_9CLOT|nr:hypothetical protein [Clostridium formicaceticum]AOY77167.1 hypothetical protein BJL90_15710 [Clostridium formicaceticum]ARE87686.1 hypothetical protein CLFO_20860 [Clostridium formicaceticum]